MKKVLCAASAFALLASTGAHALGGPKSTTKTEKLELTATDVDSHADPSIDPLSAEVLSDFDRSGIISMMAKTATDQERIDQQIQFMNKVEELIEAIGWEQLKVQYPDIASKIEGSPIAKKAGLDALELEKSLVVAERELTNQKTGESSDVAPRDDGADFGNAPTFSIPMTSTTVEAEVEPEVFEQLRELQDQLAAMAEKQLDTEQALRANQRAEADQKAKERAFAETPISLRKISGANGKYSATIMFGTSRMQVRSGDTLPNQVKILGLTQDSMSFERDGETFTVSING